jgi:hypothetical protein
MNRTELIASFRQSADSDFDTMTKDEMEAFAAERLSEVGTYAFAASLILQTVLDNETISDQAREVIEAFLA